MSSPIEAPSQPSAAAVETAPARYLLIPVDKITPSPHQARKDFDQESLKALAESIRHEGLLEPIIVRPVPDVPGVPGVPGTPGTGGRFELISGERRLRAVKLLNLPTIEAKVIETSSEAEAAAKGLVENLQREDLNPIEEAEGFKELNQLDPKYWDQPQIAKIAGKSQEYVSLSLKLLSLPHEILESIRRRILSRSHGLELLRLPSREQQLTVAGQIPGRLTREETRQLVNKLLEKGPLESPKTPEVDALAALWPLMKDNPDLAGRSWKARYLGGGEWEFRVIPSKEDVGSDLAKWFRLMEPALLDAIANTDGRVTLKSLIPKTRKELERGMSNMGDFWLPEGTGAKARLEESAVLFGPEDVFKRIFGTGSLYFRQVKGKTWQDLGCSDPKEALKTLLEGLQPLV